MDVDMRGFPTRKNSLASGTNDYDLARMGIMFYFNQLASNEEFKQSSDSRSDSRFYSDRAESKGGDLHALIESKSALLADIANLGGYDDDGNADSGLYPTALPSMLADSKDTDDSEDDPTVLAELKADQMGFKDRRVAGAVNMSSNLFDGCDDEDSDGDDSDDFDDLELGNGQFDHIAETWKAPEFSGLANSTPLMATQFARNEEQEKYRRSSKLQV